METIITVDHNIVAGLYGINNTNIDLLKHIYPKLKITARGNEVKIAGEDREVELFIDRFHLLELHFEKIGKVTETDILNITAA